MKREIWWILRKDLLAARWELAFYTCFLVGVEVMLAFLWFPMFGFAAQLMLWAVAATLFNSRCEEDRLFPQNTSWWVSRPLTRADVACAKWWFGVLALIVPGFAIRYLLSLAMGYAVLSATAVALMGSAPLAAIVLAILFRRLKLIPRRFVVVLAALLGAGGVLQGAKEVTLHTTGSLPVQAINAEDIRAVPPASVIDPWLRVDLPPKRVLMDASYLGKTMRFDNASYRFRGRVANAGAENWWYWTLKTISPEEPLAARRVAPPISSTTEQMRSHIINGQRKIHWINASLPAWHAGTERRLGGYLSWRIGEVHRVLEIPLIFDDLRIENGIRYRAESVAKGKVQIELLGPVPKGFGGDLGYNNWFGANAGVTATTRNAGRVAVFAANHWTESAGFPAFSRRHVLRFDDPRNVFPADTPLRLSLYSANFDGQWSTSVNKKIRIAGPRDEHLKAIFADATPLQEPRPSQSREQSSETVHPVNNGMDTSSFVDNLGPPGSDIRTKPPPGFDPDDPKHVRIVLDLIKDYPAAFLWLPEHARQEGQRTLEDRLRTPPVTNPLGMLAATKNMQFDDPKCIEGLGWCFIHSNYVQQFLGRALEYHGYSTNRRCSVEVLERIAEPYRSQVWEKTWRYVKLEVFTDSHLKLPPEYISEALRRNSPDALKVACVYMRRKKDIKRDPHQYQVLLDQLRKMSGYQGPPEEFEDWFKLNGFAIGTERDEDEKEFLPGEK